MAMFTVWSWFVHLTLMPCFLFHFCPYLAILPHYVCVASGLAYWLMYGWKDNLICPHSFKPPFSLGVWLTSLKLHPKWKENQIYSTKKSQKCMCMSSVLACLSKPERMYWNLTSQLETVILKVSLVALSLRDKPWRLQGQALSRKGTYGDRRFLQWLS